MATPLSTVLFTTRPFRLLSVCEVSLRVAESATATKIDRQQISWVIPTPSLVCAMDVVVVTKSAVVSRHTIQQLIAILAITITITILYIRKDRDVDDER